MNLIYVFFHKSCADGYGAAWSAWKKLGNTARYYAKQYGDDVGHIEPNSEIYIVDFSFSKEVLVGLASAGHKVTVLDHHRTAMKDLEDLLPIPRTFPIYDMGNLEPVEFVSAQPVNPVDNLTVLFDMEKSGARLSWEYFHPDTPVPALILAVEDGDLWKWTLPHSKEVRAYLGTIEWSFDAWSVLADQLDDYEARVSILTAAETLLRYQERYVKGQIEKTYFITVGGHRVRCLNATTLISEIGNQILNKYEDTPFSASFFVTEHEFIYSLRSRGDVDVGAIAKQYGGGGHPAAAGFKCSCILV